MQYLAVLERPKSFERSRTAWLHCVGRLKGRVFTLTCEAIEFQIEDLRQMVSLSLIPPPSPSNEIVEVEVV